MKNNPLPRLDTSPELREKLLPYCRLQSGEVWVDDVRGHRVGCLDASDRTAIESIMSGEQSQLAIHDPPYNLAAFERKTITEFIKWCRAWISHTYNVLVPDSSLYVWMGADQNDGFQPLPDFILMMRDYSFRPRSLITMRNQRGYGAQKNWMAVRQELLFYTKGNPRFFVDAEYTDIPKILRGYYKQINGRKTENLERSDSDTIRAGNVWVDVQQIFYRMEENVSGCHAQKPIKCIDRIVRASSSPNDVVIDFFAHECFTIDIDPIYAEITIRRLERFRSTGRTGWQNGHPFKKDFLDIKIDQLTGSNSQDSLF